MPSRTSTPAGKRRASARAATRRAAARPAAGRQAKGATAKRAATKRSANGHPAPRGATKRTATKRSAPKRSSIKRSAPKRTAAEPGSQRRAAPKRTARKPAPRRAALAFGRPSLRTSLVGLVVVLAGLAAAYFGWFRDSSLVGVREVQVSGISSPDRARIEAALSDAAKSMSTLHVREDQLAAAVKGFPTVVSVSADADLPHGLAIEVTERPPALMVESKGEAVPAAGDGTLLRGLEVGDERDSLPSITVPELPASGRLEGEALEQAAVLGAAPKPLQPLIERVSFEAQRGVEVILKGGIPIRFGTQVRATEKWAAAAAVLADPELKTLTYVDVRVPERPAVGGAADPATAPVDSAL